MPIPDISNYAVVQYKGYQKQGQNYFSLTFPVLKFQYLCFRDWKDFLRGEITELFSECFNPLLFYCQMQLLIFYFRDFITKIFL